MNDSPPSLHAGTVTFLFTDIEESTLLWERHGERMRPALARHDALLRETIAARDGQIVKTTGDGLLAVFAGTENAVQAALAAQHALADEPWPAIAPDSVRVRMGLHCGEAQLRDSDYFGTAVNRAARIMDLAHGRQILLSGELAEQVSDSLTPDVTLRDLGQHPLRGLREASRIFQLNAPGLARDFPPLRSGASLVGNLPAQTSSFVGRGRETAEIRAMLAETRLLTITGPGGTGKSRLSLQIAADVQPAYEHGAWLVELAPVTDPALVVAAVTTVFDLSGQSPEETREMLFDYLREKDLLLILDNCEHLISVTAQLAAELISASPELTILASSREGLGVYGEATYHLPTLSLPAENARNAASIGQSEAVQLFVERARAVQPHFELGEGNAAAVAQVVRRLDGIPLAIELAAARLKVFTVEQIAGRLDNRFRLLTGGSRTALPRQQTLRALIDWSYDLLDEDERTLFRRLSAFSGGWTFEAAEQVAGSLDAFTLLPQLVDKSLVMREADPAVVAGTVASAAPQARYHFLETIRQYARDRLVEAGEVEMARDRHFAYYEELARSANFGAEVALLQEGQMTLEQDNLRAAMQWGIDRYPDRVLTVIWQLLFFLSDQLPGQGFMDYTVVALEQLETLPVDDEEAAKRKENARYCGLVALSMLKMFLGQINEASQIAREVYSALRESDYDPFLLAVTLFVQGQTSFFMQDPALDDLTEEAINLLQTMSDHPGQPAMLALIHMLGVEGAAQRGDMQQAERHIKEVNAYLESAGEDMMPWAEFSLLIMMMHFGIDPDALRAQQEKVIDILRRSRSRRMAAMAESDWAHRLRHDGQTAEAMAIYRRMLVEWRELGHRAAMANILENMAFIDRAAGRPARAATLFGAAERMRETVGQDMLPLEREEYDREIAALRAAAPERLPPAELDAAWTAGRALSTDDLVTRALESE